MEKNFAISILLVMVLLTAALLFFFNLSSQQGGTVSMIDKVIGAFKNLFACFPIQSQKCFCGSNSQPCCDAEPKCSSNLQCGKDDSKCACPEGKTFDTLSKNCK